ncbi:MAG: hypothetical protein II240_03550 [Bacteroidaceae bacterium]|nr:hypothetical protein [Bacteroidaceae bacterium]
MADSILRLRVEDKEYNASLKQARQGLLALQQALQQSGATFQNVDKATVEYARGLGRMETVAKTAKGRIGEMTSAFTDLSVQYRHLTEEERQSPFGQALSESLSQLSGRVREAKDELADITQELNNLGDAAEEVGTETSGSLSDMISVFGGNMMTKGAELAASAIRALGDEIISTGKQAMEMSVQSEGIRMAFERLNRPGLLDNLRAATHGTVNDLQLMQAAVKFEDFKLPLDELGTMLAFAQQKAKDTGQSVDYLVDSIVNGLGRQSTQILDNLGLSQAEVKERTKETGDMTVAVGQIIREQMQAAGDYVETATDRALKANAEYENSLVELGDRMRETFNIGSMDEVNMYLKNEVVQTMLFTVDVIDRAKDAIHSLTQPMEDALAKMDEIGKNNGFVNFMNKVISTLGPLINVRSLLHDINSLVGGSSGGGGGVGGYMRRMSGYIGDARSQGNGDKYTVVSRGGKVVSATHTGVDGSVIDYTGRYATPVTGGGRGGRGGRGGGGGRGTVTPKEEKIDLKSLFPDEGEIHDAAVSYAEQIRSSISEAMAASATSADENAFRNFMQVAIENGMTDLSIDWEELGMQIFSELGIPDEKWEEIQKEFNERLAAMGKDALQIDTKTGNWKKPKKEKSDKKEESTIGKDVTQIVGSVNNIVSGLNSLGIEVPAGIAKVLGVMQVIIGIISAIQIILAIIGVKSSIPFFANGGIVRAAGGFQVPGNSFSGDRVPALLNSGELVLNRSQQGVLANALSGNAFDNLELTASLNGEDIVFAIDNASRRRGKGTMVRLRNS